MPTQTQTQTQTPKVIANSFVRKLVFTCGWLSFVLGLIGALLPVMPTTPFMLLAAICFSRSSPKFYVWITSHKYFGPALANFLAGYGLPLRAKILALSTLWLSAGYGTYIANLLWAKYVMLGTALAVSIYLLSVPTDKRNAAKTPS